MRRSIKFVLVLVLIVAAVFTLTACGSADFNKVFDASNFENVTVKRDFVAPPIIIVEAARGMSMMPSSTFTHEQWIPLLATKFTVRIGWNKTLIESGSGAYAQYTEINAGESTNWVKEFDHYYQGILAAFNSNGNLNLEFGNFKPEDFVRKGGYLVLKADAVSSYGAFLRSIDPAGGPLNQNEVLFKIKIRNNKLTELLIEVNSAEEISGIKIRYNVKYTFGSYGKTSVTKPGWINNTNFP